MKKRTITSLKENEVIKIENRKQAKAIKKQSLKEGFLPIDIPNGGIYISLSQENKNMLFWTYCNMDFRKEKLILPASDFITKKPKPATKKWVKEYVAQQLAKPKEVVEPEVVSATGVEAGKWYNAYFSKANGGEKWGLIYIDYLSTTKTHADYYGKIIFGENKGWVEKDSLSLMYNILSPATEQGVKDMLIEEIKKGNLQDSVINSLKMIWKK